MSQQKALCVRIFISWCGVLPGLVLALQDSVLCLRLFPVHLVNVLGQAAGLLCIKAAEVTFEGKVLAVDPAVYSKGSCAGAGGVATFWTLLRMDGLMY